MYVHCTVPTMSEQVPTINDTTVRQAADCEAVSTTADAIGRFIAGLHVSAHGSKCMHSGYETSWCDLAVQ